jgi:hypothetical protein
VDSFSEVGHWTTRTSTPSSLCAATAGMNHLMLTLLRLAPLAAGPIATGCASVSPAARRRPGFGPAPAASVDDSGARQRWKRGDTPAELLGHQPLVGESSGVRPVDLELLRQLAVEVVRSLPLVRIGVV